MDGTIIVIVWVGTTIVIAAFRKHTLKGGEATIKVGCQRCGCTSRISCDRGGLHRLLKPFKSGYHFVKF
jgi:hypothetical protein